MSDVETESVTSPARPVITTAEELAALRTARGLSQIDISQRIKLQPRQVQAIEDGRWADLPGLSFARGAVRSYAKLVNADVAPLLEAIGGYSKANGAVSPSSLRRSGLGPAAPIGLDSSNRSGHPYLWVTAGLAGVVLLVFFFGTGRDGGGLNAWFPSAGSGSAGTTTTTAPAASTGTSAGSISGPTGGSGARTSSGNPVLLGEAALSPLNPSPAAVAPPTTGASSGSVPASGASAPAPAATAPMPAPSPTSVAAVTPAPAPSPSAATTTSTPEASGSAGAPAAASSAAASSTTPAAPQASPAGGPSTTPVKAADGSAIKGQIVLRAGEESWVEVRQADGKALHVGTLAAGGELSLQGQPPYRLTLGNPGKLTLVYEGATRDLAAVTSRTNIARITLN